MAKDESTPEMRSRRRLGDTLLELKAKKIFTNEQIGVLAVQFNVQDSRFYQLRKPRFKRDDDSLTQLAEIGDSIRDRNRILSDGKLTTRLAQTGMLLLAVGDSRTEPIPYNALRAHPLTKSYLDKYRQKVPSLHPNVVIDETLMRDLHWYEETAPLVSDRDEE